MKPKKSKKADLERNISTYFSLGLVIALSLSLIAFEWMSEAGTNSNIDIGGGDYFPPDEIPSTFPEKAKAEIPKIPPETFIIRENWEPVFDSIYWGDPEIKPGDSIDIYIPLVRDEPDYVEPEVVIANEMPGFMDGDLHSFAKWAQRNIKYPAIAAENGVSGKVYLQFVVEKDGSLSNIIVLKGRDPALDAEALRVIGSSPKWKPGANIGIPVRVRCSIMINFVLQ